MAGLSEVYINRMAAVLPNEAVANEQMEAVLGMAGDVPSRVRNMILRSNGIKSRYYAIDPHTREATHTVTGLAAEAVEALFAQGVDRNAVTVLACGTTYPDQILPSHGVMVHGALHDVPPYEVLSAAGVCTAGMAALKYAYNSIRTGEHEHAVACAAETASAVMRKEVFQPEIDAKQLENAKPDIAFEKDFLRWMLSDGAGALYLGKQPNAEGMSFKIKWIDLVSYANEMPVCMYGGGQVQEGQFSGWKEYSQAYRDTHSLMSIKQDVKLLNEHIIRYTVEKALQHALARYDLQAHEVDYFLPHYSSGYFRDKVYAGLQNIGFEIPFEKWFTNLPSKGNTGSASIYIMLEEFARTHTLSHGQKILCYIPESGRFSSSFMLLEVVKHG